MNYKKCLIAMRTTLVLVFLMCGFLNANSKTNGVSADFIGIQNGDNLMSISEVLEFLEKQTKYNYIYNHDDLKKVKIEKIDFKGLTTKQILDRCLKDVGYKYEILNDVIIISEKKAKPEKFVVKGKVLDNNKKPLIGASIYLKGTASGVATNAKGEFTISFAKQKNMILAVSFIGMKNKEIVLVKNGVVKVKDINKIIITLEEDKKVMDEVVITGYGKQSKNSFTGSAVTIKKDELKTVNPTSVMSAIQILDPSFRIKENVELGSDPNALPEINLRGQSGIGLNAFEEGSINETALRNNPNLPTFILDGFEVDLTRIFDLDVNTIETITLLKDAAASAIYGSRAANGVIVIQTKPLKEGELRVTYNANIKINTPDLSHYNLMGPKEKMELEEAAGLYDFEAGVPIFHYIKLRTMNEKKRFIESGVNTDWMALPLRNSVAQNHSVRLEGGTKVVKYGINYANSDDQGVMKGSSRKRNSLGFDLKYNTKGLVFRNSVNLSLIKSTASPYGTFSEYAALNAYTSPYDKYGNYLVQVDGNGALKSPNPIYDSSLNSHNVTEYKEVTDNFSVQYYLTDHLFTKASVGISYRFTDTDNFKDPRSTDFISQPTGKGTLSVSNKHTTTWDAKWTAHYNNTFKKNNLNITLGVNFKETTSSNYRASYKSFPAGGYSEPEFAGELVSRPITGEDENRLMGAFTRINYTYDNVILADFSYRVDGNSSFGKKKKYAPFWSVGGGLNLHNIESIKHKLSFIDRLKVRYSLGVTGKANFAQSIAQNVYKLNIATHSAHGFGVDLMALGNENLKWETTYMSDAGLELSLFKGLLYFDYTYYVKNTKDLIGDMYLQSSSGFLAYKENIGEIKNTGHELRFRSRLVSNKDLQIYLNGNIASNRNKLVNISDAMKRYNEEINKKSSLKNEGYYQKPSIRYYEGASMTAIYAMQSLGIDPLTGKEYYLYKDGTTGFDVDGSQAVVVGDTEPDANGSFGFNINYKGFTLNTYFAYEFGGDRYNSTLMSKIENVDIRKNVDKRILDSRWFKVGDVTTMKSIADADEMTPATSRFVQKYNMLKLNTLSVGYIVPKKYLSKFRLKRLKFQFNMQDLFTVSSVKREMGTSYPFARNYNLTINASF